MSDPADLLIVGGRVFVAYRPTDLVPYGSDVGPRPVGAANAVAVRDGRIAWIGREDEGLRDWRGPATEVVEAHGGLITAGFDDAHIHLVEGADELDRVDLFGLGSLERVQAAIARHAAARSGRAWVLGKGWLYVTFPGGLPTAPCSTRSSPTGRRSWAASTAIPAGRTRRPSGWPASTERHPTPPTG